MGQRTALGFHSRYRAVFDAATPTKNLKVNEDGDFEALGQLIQEQFAWG